MNELLFSFYSSSFLLQSSAIIVFSSGNFGLINILEKMSHYVSFDIAMWRATICINQSCSFVPHIYNLTSKQSWRQNFNSSTQSLKRIIEQGILDVPGMEGRRGPVYIYPFKDALVISLRSSPPSVCTSSPPLPPFSSLRQPPPYFLFNIFKFSAIPLLPLHYFLPHFFITVICSFTPSPIYLNSVSFLWLLYHSPVPLSPCISFSTLLARFFSSVVHFPVIPISTWYCLFSSPIFLLYSFLPVSNGKPLHLPWLCAIPLNSIPGSSGWGGHPWTRVITCLCLLFMFDLFIRENTHK